MYKFFQLIILEWVESSPQILPKMFFILQLIIRRRWFLLLCHPRRHPIRMSRHLKEVRILVPTRVRKP